MEIQGIEGGELDENKKIKFRTEHFNHLTLRDGYLIERITTGNLTSESACLTARQLMRTTKVIQRLRRYINLPVDRLLYPLLLVLPLVLPNHHRPLYHLPYHHLLVHHGA
jgi:hypothetical protein